MQHSGRSQRKLSLRSYRTPGRIVYATGFLFLLAGAGMTCWGSVLPWLTFKVFGLPIVLSGVVGLGSVTALLALFALTRTRTFPLINVLLGLACALVGSQVPKLASKAVIQQMLTVKMRLSSLNAQLEEASLPAVEPFPDGLSAQNTIGPGPQWVVWGGLVIAAGGALQFAGGRLERTCAYCANFWPRDRNVLFCPRCGNPAVVSTRCERCLTALQRRDRFCVNCGTPAPRRNSENPEQAPPPIA